jgi:hypothetical protein
MKDPFLMLSVRKDPFIAPSTKGPERIAAPQESACHPVDLAKPRSRRVKGAVQEAPKWPKQESQLVGPLGAV